MFPSRKDFGGITCPASVDCPCGPDSCPFSHTLEGKTTTTTSRIPPLGVLKSRIVTLKPTHMEVGHKPVKPAKPVKPDSKVESQHVPQVQLEANCKFPWKLRQCAVEKIYQALGGTSKVSQLALNVESEIYGKSSTRQVYSSLFASKIQQLRKGQKKVVENSQEIVPLAALSGLVHDMDTLINNGYSFGVTIPKYPSFGVNCERCGKSFNPETYYKDLEREKCHFHDRRKVKVMGGRVHSCCQRNIGDLPCQEASVHVFSTSNSMDLQDIKKWEEKSTQIPVLAIDAEMVYCLSGLEIARFSAVDWNEEVIIDVLVQPSTEIIDYNSRFSGITEESFSSLKANPYNNPNFGPSISNVIIPYCNLIKEVLPHYLGPKTILLGHSLESDLCALKVSTDQVVDTSILFPHDTSLKAKKSLRDLAKIHLQEFIQEGSNGHNSIEDAVTCLRLVKKFITTPQGGNRAL